MDFIAMLDTAAGQPPTAVESSEDEETIRASVAYYRSILRGQLDSTPEMK